MEPVVESREVAGAVLLALVLVPFAPYLLEGLAGVFKTLAAATGVVEKLNATPPDPAAAQAEGTLEKILGTLTRALTNPWFVAALLGAGAIYEALTRTVE